MQTRGRSMSWWKPRGPRLGPARGQNAPGGCAVTSCDPRPAPVSQHFLSGAHQAWGSLQRSAGGELSQLGFSSAFLLDPDPLQKTLPSGTASSFSQGCKYPAELCSHHCPPGSVRLETGPCLLGQAWDSWGFERTAPARGGLLELHLPGCVT